MHRVAKSMPLIRDTRAFFTYHTLLSPPMPPVPAWPCLDRGPAFEQPRLPRPARVGEGLVADDGGAPRERLQASERRGA